MILFSTSCYQSGEKAIPGFFAHGWPKQSFGQPYEFLGSFRAGGIRRHIPVPPTARFATGCYTRSARLYLRRSQPPPRDQLPPALRPGLGIVFALLAVLLAGCGAAVDRFVPLAPVQQPTPPGGPVVLFPAATKLADPEVIGELFSPSGRHVTVRTGPGDLARAFDQALAEALTAENIGWRRAATGWDGTPDGLAGWPQGTVLIMPVVEKFWLRKAEKIVYTEREISMTAACRIGLPASGTVIRRTVTVEHRVTTAGRDDLPALASKALAEAARQLARQLAPLVEPAAQQR